MELRQKSERFTINDPAHVPGIPTSLNRPAIDLAGSVVGLVIGCLIAFTRELRNGRLLGAWELPPSALILAHVPQIAPSHSAGGGYVERRELDSGAWLLCRYCCFLYWDCLHLGCAWAFKFIMYEQYFGLARNPFNMTPDSGAPST